MYCFCLRLLDRMFVQMDADYADFNTVLAALRLRLVEALAQRPLSFREFKRIIAAGAADSEGSVTSAGALSSQLSAGSASERSDRSGEPDNASLQAIVAEALNMPRHLDGLRTGLQGAAAALSDGLSKTLRPPGTPAGGQPP